MAGPLTLLRFGLFLGLFECLPQLGIGNQILSLYLIGFGQLQDRRGRGRVDILALGF